MICPWLMCPILYSNNTSEFRIYIPDATIEKVRSERVTWRCFSECLRMFFIPSLDDASLVFCIPWTMSPLWSILNWGGGGVWPMISEKNASSWYLSCCSVVYVRVWGSSVRDLLSMGIDGRNRQRTRNPRRSYQGHVGSPWHPIIPWRKQAKMSASQIPA